MTNDGVAAHYLGSMTEPESDGIGPTGGGGGGGGVPPLIRRRGMVWTSFFSVSIQPPVSFSFFASDAIDLRDEISAVTAAPAVPLASHEIPKMKNLLNGRNKIRGRKPSRTLSST